jgi:hypothetical protein
VGKLLQSSKNQLIPKHDSKPLKITHWKIIKINSLYLSKNILEVIVGNRSWLIYNITLDRFNEINYHNSKEFFKYVYAGSRLICDECSGIGIIDWISKATLKKSNYNMSILDLKNSYKYVRNKKGPITKLLTINDEEIYISTPKLRKGEEFCSKCYGCGIRLNETVMDIKDVIFDKC